MAAVWGMIIAVWISLVGMFILAIVRDGQVTAMVIDSATKLVGAAVGGWSLITGVHIYVSGKSQQAPAPTPIATMPSGTAVSP